MSLNGTGLARRGIPTEAPAIPAGTHGLAHLLGLSPRTGRRKPMHPPPPTRKLALAAALSLALGVVHGVLAGPGGAAGVGSAIAARLIERLGKTPYDRYETADRLGRTITFFLAQANKTPAKPTTPPSGNAPSTGEAAEPPALAEAPIPTQPPATPTEAVPLVVFVQGSGAGSHFIEVGDKIGTTSGFPHIHDALRGRGRVMVVEKPGVEVFSQPAQPGSAEGASDSFKREHTLDRWAEAVRASINAALELPGIDHTRLLVMGHSEGGLVACRVAALEPRVTHVAVLAGGGPSQLFDFTHMARHGGMFDMVSSSPDERVKWINDAWAGVLDDPESADKMWFGHPHRRWTTFCVTSPVEQLLKCDPKLRVYIAQGTADRAVAPITAEILDAELRARGRDVTLNLIDGGDHGFFTQPERPGTGMKGVFGACVEWFLDK